jgi:hypothetical protein
LIKGSFSFAEKGGDDSVHSLNDYLFVLFLPLLFFSYHHYVDGDLSILMIIFESIIVLICLEACRHLDRNTTTTIPPSILMTSCMTKSPTVSTTEFVHSSSNHTAFWSMQYMSMIRTGSFFSIMLVTGLVALHCNSLSMIIVSRNVANLVLLVGDYIAFGKFPDVYVATIYNLLLAGAIVAALRQHTFTVTRTGLLWMIANCISTSGYILSLKQLLTTHTKTATTNTITNNSNDGNDTNIGHLSTPQPALQPSVTPNKSMRYGIIFVNNVSCIMLLLPAAYVLGEISLFAKATAVHTTEYASKTILAGFLCFLFHYALLNCVEQSTIIHHPVDLSSGDTSKNTLQQLLLQQRRPSISDRRLKKILV